MRFLAIFHGKYYPKMVSLNSPSEQPYNQVMT
nr:MAG TPA: hypothetical protein [Caudoviricetes sp.]